MERTRDRSEAFGSNRLPILNKDFHGINIHLAWISEIFSFITQQYSITIPKRGTGCIGSGVQYLHGLSFQRWNLFCTSEISASSITIPKEGTGALQAESFSICIACHFIDGNINAHQIVVDIITRILSEQEVPRQNPPAKDRGRLEPQVPEGGNDR